MEQEKQGKKEECCPGHGKVPVFGYILVILGVIFLAEKVFKANVLGALPWGYIWPAVIILFGVHIIVKRSKKE